MTNIFFKHSDIFFIDKFFFRKNLKIWLTFKKKFEHRRKSGLEYLAGLRSHLLPRLLTHYLQSRPGHGRARKAKTGKGKECRTWKNKARKCLENNPNANKSDPFVNPMDREC